jgi:hypothetical protein
MRKERLISVAETCSTRSLRQLCAFYRPHTYTDWQRRVPAAIGVPAVFASGTATDSCSLIWNG